MNIPVELKYTNTHTWLENMDDNNYRVGITDFAQNELGDIVYVESPEVGRQFAQLEECAVVESVKSTSDIYCPMSGEIIKINPALEDTPEIINEKPYSDGWIFIIKVSDIDELEELINAEEYIKLTEE